MATDCKESGGKAAEVMEADLTSDAGVDTVRQSTLKLKPLVMWSHTSCDRIITQSP